MFEIKTIVMRILKVFLIAIVAGSFTFSCFKDQDDSAVLASEVNDFVWKGMNAVYLYKDNVPDLADNRFSTDQEYGNYLNSYATPDDLFESLIYQRQTVDRFSWITDDYIALEQLFQGTSKSDGLKFDFYYEPNSTTNVAGVVKFVMNGSPADNAGVQRGQLFNAVDGTQLTTTNLNDLLTQDNYTLDFADYNDHGTPSDTSDDTIDPNGTSADIVSDTYTENPVYKTAIIDVGGTNLGYLMYDGFTADFDKQLNDAFAEFKSNNVQYLALDLRYNYGGSTRTSSYLGSMVTGQFLGQVYAKLTSPSAYLTQLGFNFDYPFTDKLSDNTPINSLNLNKVYILTTNDTASASEMVINSLREYINVVQIGDITRGKSQASITIYDSPSLVNKQGINPNHTYAMQPLVSITVNKNDGRVPATGLVPDIEMQEHALDMGVLGDPNEPLLAAVINDIQNGGRSVPSKTKTTLMPAKVEIDKTPLKYDMHIDKR